MDKPSWKLVSTVSGTPASVASTSGTQQAKVMTGTPVVTVADVAELKPQVAVAVEPEPGFAPVIVPESATEVHTVLNEEQGVWENRLNGATVNSFRTQGEAIAAGEELSRQNAAEHHIHNYKGRVTKRTKY